MGAVGALGMDTARACVVCRVFGTLFDVKHLCIEGSWGARLSSLLSFKHTHTHTYTHLMLTLYAGLYL